MGALPTSELLEGTQAARSVAVPKSKQGLEPKQVSVSAYAERGTLLSYTRRCNTAHAPAGLPGSALGTARRLAPDQRITQPRFVSVPSIWRTGTAVVGSVQRSTCLRLIPLRAWTSTTRTTQPRQHFFGNT